MASEHFKATRLSWDNFLFPARIEIAAQEIILVEWHWLRRRKTTVDVKNITSIHIRNMRFTSEILFKNSRGVALLKVQDLRKSDARRIRHLVESALGV